MRPSRAARTEVNLRGGRRVTIIWRVRSRTLLLPIHCSSIARRVVRVVAQGEVSEGVLELVQRGGGRQAHELVYVGVQRVLREWRRALEGVQARQQEIGGSLGQGASGRGGGGGEEGGA
jgi:hypothetical protein